MDFRTILEIKKADFTISHSSRILSIGSCFAENIGNRLSSFRFDIDVNPFGIQYNPASIAKGLQILIDRKRFAIDDIFYANDVWSSMMHHSDFSATTSDECLSNINSRIESASARIRNIDFYLITFGTAWIYELLDSGEVVSNCHKLPSNKFHRRRLSVDEIVELYKNLIDKLLHFSPNARFIFSVSPIRHWKDGAHENQISKSTLLLAVEQLREYSPRVSYFPSYELVLDDLRDYRFYDSDMIHPNSVAIEYVWEKLSATYFSASTMELCKRILALVQASQHRPFNANTEAFSKFLKTNHQKALQLKTEFPNLQIDDLINYFGNLSER